MFNINIYSKYRVVEDITTNYKTYDSDSEDWWKEDRFVNEYIIDGGELKDKLIGKLIGSDFSDLTIITIIKDYLKVEINTFDPMNGDGDNYIYYIKRVSEE